ncbi:conserved hypothetical protein [Theileria equi strain WA]|uniref:DDRGK domain-containing protein 1 n=1 Tax=Theileria equi strain WA TaxID=1537102 RepID=L1LD08_THEEQ|nr:conserved hypothetical protein [Theileria equi strain WA]EKX73302.1 conserved hypothetical protein [Theileria equi strain WA]|eukprot:XP_004832754.1 conserved hypothetical protein [Theileria equi strain WA]
MDDKSQIVSPIATAVVLFLFTITFVLIYLTKFQGSSLNVAPEVQTGPSEAQESTTEEDEKPKKTLTTKQKKRQELKEEKKRQKALQDEEREEKEKILRKKQEILEAKRAEQEKLRKEQEQKRLEEEEKAYKELTSKFVIEREGVYTPDVEFSIEDFIEFITSKKLCNVEELSTRFSLKAEDVVKRINELEEQDRIFGLLDDQGRYIYITQNEVDSILSHIKRGRVHKSDLAPYFNSVISLEPTKKVWNFINA